MLKRKVLLTCSLLVLSGKCYSWSDDGHKLVGAIAEKMMSQDAKDMVRGILGIEPLLVSAIWPDLVRDSEIMGKKNDPVNDFSPYHFCEIPKGQTYDSNPKKIAKDCLSVLLFTENSIISNNFPRETKMISLRYLIHVVGDVHQPFHVGNGFDRGANACLVKQENSNSIVNLHTFWDSNIVNAMKNTLTNEQMGGKPPKYFSDFFTAFFEKHKAEMTEANKIKYGAGTMIDWLEETKVLRETIYPDAPGSLNGVTPGLEYKNRKYCAYYADQTIDPAPIPGTEVQPNNAAIIDSAYLDKNIPVVEQQIVKAGLRLAYKLDQIAAKYKAQGPKITDAQETSILQSLQNLFTKLFK